MDAPSAETPEDAETEHGRMVLGQDILDAVRNCVGRTVLPSWHPKVPCDCLTATRGKLSCDNYRAIGLVHLTYVLIEQWAEEMGRKHQMLHNYMHMVASVKLSNMRIATDEYTGFYNLHIAEYVKGLQTLFPNEKLHPVHHAAMHVGDFMNLLGPNHSHSVPYYERYIHCLQQINTNLKPGKCFELSRKL